MPDVPALHEGLLLDNLIQVIEEERAVFGEQKPVALKLIVNFADQVITGSPQLKQLFQVPI